jgi:hypothetical protein
LCVEIARSAWFSGAPCFFTTYTEDRSIQYVRTGRTLLARAKGKSGERVDIHACMQSLGDTTASAVAAGGNHVMCRLMRIPWRECTCLCVRVTGAAEWRISIIFMSRAARLARCSSIDRVECMPGVTRERAADRSRGHFEDLVTTYENEARRQVHEFICRMSLITPRTKANDFFFEAHKHTWAALLHSQSHLD